VIVDALRASATIIAALRTGAGKVITVLSVEEADRYVGDPTCRVAGERGGAQLPQFHYGNSPTQVWAHRDEIAGRTFVLTTSNGTRCIDAALAGAADLLVGSTLNATAAARVALALARQQGCGISLVAAGLQDQPAEEDAYAVGVIGARLASLGARLPTHIHPVAETDSLRVFQTSSSAKALVCLGYDEDVRFCAQVDLWETVPVYCGGGFVKFSGV
jgi:2-phosphosulfolactate phosphatase